MLWGNQLMMKTLFIIQHEDFHPNMTRFARQFASPPLRLMKYSHCCSLKKLFLKNDSNPLCQQIHHLLRWLLLETRTTPLAEALGVGVTTSIVDTEEVVVATMAGATPISFNNLVPTSSLDLPAKSVTGLAILQ